MSEPPTASGPGAAPDPAGHEPAAASRPGGPELSRCRIIRLAAALESGPVLNLATALMVVAAALMLTEAFTRTFLSLSTEWIEEVVRFSVVWSVFLVFGFACRRGHYIQTDLVVRLLPPRVQKAAEVLNALAGLLFAGMLLWAGWVQTAHLIRLGIVAETMNLPMWLVKGALLVGAVSLLAYFISALVSRSAAFLADLRGTAHG